MRKPRANSASAAARGAREVPPEMIECVQEAGLRYVSDDSPGITRRGAGQGMAFIGVDGRRITDRDLIRRIRRLAIPPAWTQVWICPHANGHIQATGRDQRGRKQYRYHEDWRATRDATKYGRMVAFGRALPRIRARVGRDLKQRGSGRDKVLAAIVRLLETTLIRVGNDEYARENGSFGLTTLRNRHARVRGAKITFSFTGKSGKKHEIDLKEPRLAAIVAQMQDLPGQELFGYIAEDGSVVDVKSDDVNAYLRDVAGEEFSAKDFRTWAGTMLAARMLAMAANEPEHKHTKKNLAAVVKDVAARLGNTPSVCRKCYIHPAVLEAYLGGEVVRAARTIPVDLPHPKAGLSAEEKDVLRFLERKARQPTPKLVDQLERSVRSGAAPRRVASAERRAIRRLRRPASRLKSL
jgi:DNA topoisomerase I